MERTHPVAVCDPWPVLSAKKQLGAVKVDNSKLSDLQRSILDFIIKRGKATVEEMGMHFELPEFKIQNQSKSPNWNLITNLNTLCLKLYIHK